MTICLSVIYPGKLLLQGLISMDHVSSLLKLKQTDVPFHKQKQTHQFIDQVAMRCIPAFSVYILNCSTFQNLSPFSATNQNHRILFLHPALTLIYSLLTSHHSLYHISQLHMNSFNVELFELSRYLYVRLHLAVDFTLEGSRLSGIDRRVEGVGGQQLWLGHDFVCKI